MGNNVAILCAAHKTAYTAIPGVEIYDDKRDCRTFEGGMPIVAHPPCRAWSSHCSHLAKPPPGEADLGLFCADMLKQCGGILEHPAGSRLFKAAGLPTPGHGDSNLWTAHVWQAWWDYPLKKATWLCFSGISHRAVQWPYALHAPGSDGRTFKCMSPEGGHDAKDGQLACGDSQEGVDMTQQLGF